MHLITRHSELVCKKILICMRQDQNNGFKSPARSSKPTSIRLICIYRYVVLLLSQSQSAREAALNATLVLDIGPRSVVKATQGLPRKSYMKSVRDMKVQFTGLTFPSLFLTVINDRITFRNISWFAFKADLGQISLLPYLMTKFCHEVYCNTISCLFIKTWNTDFWKLKSAHSKIKLSALQSTMHRPSFQLRDKGNFNLAVKLCCMKLWQKACTTI